MESNKTHKPSWNAYWIKMCHLVASRGSCSRRQIGAVIVSDDNILLSSGYNGTPRGVKNCNEGGCARCNNQGAAQSGTNLGECLCVHGEENAIVQAARQGIAIKGATLYTSFCPCSYCAKSIVNAGIKKVFFDEAYAMDDVTKALFSEAEVQIYHYTHQEVQAPKQADISYD